MNCSKCGFVADPNSLFCESCGETFQVAVSTLPPPQQAAANAAAAAVGKRACGCGAATDKIDKDGICTVCGEMVAQGSARDHLQIRLDAGHAAYSDIGRKHWRNEDCVAMVRDQVKGEDTTVFVVSDGVSTSSNPDQASEQACQAAAKSVIDALEAGTADVSTAVLNAIADAQKAVVQLSYPPHKEPPEATIVVGVVRAGTATVGWLGDSRAYTVAHLDGSVQAILRTEDHSWINDAVKSGEMTLEQAMADRRSHSITQSLGELPDGEVPEPSVLTFPMDGITWLIGCTDGFWNYAHLRQDQPPEPMLDLVRDLPLDTEALAVAQMCVDFANRQGGHDNITVAVVAA